MVFNTISVGTAVSPAVIQTYFSHVRYQICPRASRALIKETAVPQSKASPSEAYGSYLVP